MNSPFTTLAALAAFILIFGGLTLWIVLRVLRGLWLQWGDRARARALAAAEGWRYAGHEQFGGALGEREWRGGPHEDDDDGRRWTDFEGGVPGVSPGGFAVLSRASWKSSRARERKRQRSAPPDNVLFRAEAAIGQALHQLTGGAFEPSPERPEDDRRSWQPLDVGSEVFRQRWVLLADHARWGAVWTPAVEALWQRAHAAHAGDILVLAQGHFLTLKRDDGKTAPTLEQVADVLRLGQALMQATQAEAAHPPRDAPRP